MESTTCVAPDISCEHCQRSIEGTLSKLDGVSAVKVNIPGKTVHVNYDSQKLDQQKLETTLDDLGYTVTH